MRFPLASPAAFVLVLLSPAALAWGEDASRPKSPDVMTVNGAQVPAPAAVPDITAPPRVEAGRPAPRAFASRAEYEAALAELASRDAARKAGARETAAAKPPGSRPAAGSIPALLGPLPRPAWGAGLVAKPEPKPADVVTIGEPTGIDAPPAAPAAVPSGTAPAAAKPQRDVTTQEPRAATAPPPSAPKPEVKR